MNEDKKEHFIIMVPPPNSTGELHIGHAFTMFVQDAIIRLKQILGHTAFLVGGLDHGGISGEYITRKVLKKQDVTLEEIKKITSGYGSKIIKQLKEMGLAIDYKYFAYTMDSEHIKLVQKTFINLYDKGYIKRKRTIFACDTIFKTAISDLEINHVDLSGKLYLVKYLLEDGSSISVATTRPETIFADVALAVHPEDSRYKHLIGKKAKIPLENRWIDIIADKLVEIEFGTGVLKITPAHSKTDWQIGLKHKLPILCIFNKSGLCTLKNPLYNNKNTKELKEIVSNSLNLSYEIIKQSIPHSSRSNSPVEYLVENQWFFDVKPLAQKALAKHPNLFPSHWLKTYKHWLENIEPWCISRTIKWGQAIPAYENSKKELYVGFNPPEDFVSTGEVFDTWFSSALWTVMYQERFSIAIDLVVTGYDILFFWIARMVMMNINYNNQLPFKSVLIHGLICDKSGRKMSKTTGNTINPMEVIKEHGLQPFRHALISAFTESNRIKFSIEYIKDSKKILNKLKNLDCFMDRLSPNQLTNHSKLIKSIYAIIEQYTKDYKKNIDQLNIQKISHIAREFLYFVCDWIVEFAKLDSVFNEVLIFAHSQVHSMFYPLIAHRKSIPLLDTTFNNFNRSAFDNLKSNVTIIRFFAKHDPLLIVGGKNSDFMNRLGKVKTNKQTTDLFHKTINLGDYIINFTKDISEPINSSILIYKKELCKIKPVLLSKSVPAHVKKPLLERRDILNSLLRSFDEYLNK